jgi:hypothetical protein
MSSQPTNRGSRRCALGDSDRHDKGRTRNYLYIKRDIREDRKKERNSVVVSLKSQEKVDWGAPTPRTKTTNPPLEPRLTFIIRSILVPHGKEL